LDAHFRELERQVAAGDLSAKRRLLANQCRLEGHTYGELRHSGNRIDNYIYQACDRCLDIRSVFVDELQWPSVFVGQYKLDGIIHRMSSYGGFSMSSTLCNLRIHNFISILVPTINKRPTACKRCLAKEPHPAILNAATRIYRTFELMHEVRDPWKYVMRLKEKPNSL